MEVLVNASDKTSKKYDVEGNGQTTMIEWEMISFEERVKYAGNLIAELIKKCKDPIIIRLLRCLLPKDKNSLAYFIAKVGHLRVENVERYLFLLVCFLDPRGTEASLPGVQDHEIVRALYEMPLVKFQNLLPVKCGGCRKWYALSHLQVPEVTCGKCFRGRHDCKPVPKAESKLRSKVFWFCCDCGYEATKSFNGYDGNAKMWCHSFQSKDNKRNRANEASGKTYENKTSGKTYENKTSGKTYENKTSKKTYGNKTNGKTYENKTSGKSEDNKIVYSKENASETEISGDIEKNGSETDTCSDIEKNGSDASETETCSDIEMNGESSDWETDDVNSSEDDKDFPKFIFENPDDYLDYESESTSDYDSDAYEYFMKTYEEEEVAKETRKNLLALQSLTNVAFQNNFPSLKGTQKDTLGGNPRKKKFENIRNQRRKRGGSQANSGNFKMGNSDQDLIDDQCRTAIGKRASVHVREKGACGQATTKSFVSQEEIISAIEQLRMDASLGSSTGAAEPAINLVTAKETVAYAISMLVHSSLQERAVPKDYTGARHLFIFKEL